MKLLLYCVKTKPWLVKKVDLSTPGKKPNFVYDLSNYKQLRKFNGKIVAECDFEVEEIIKKCVGVFKYCYRTKTLDEYALMYKTQLVGESMNEYLQGKGYAIHIKNLHIFDEPRDIRNYYNIAPRTMQDCMNQKALLKAPQNMCNAYDVYKNHYIVISIQPQWVCKILNGEKTIEVRKKVLKEMIR